MTNSQLFKQAIAIALPSTILFTVMCAVMAVLFAAAYASANASNADNTAQVVTANDSVEIMLKDIQAAIDDSGVEGITIVYNK